MSDDHAEEARSEKPSDSQHQEVRRTEDAPTLDEESPIRVERRRWRVPPVGVVD